MQIELTFNIFSIVFNDYSIIFPTMFKNSMMYCVSLLFFPLEPRRFVIG